MSRNALLALTSNQAWMTTAIGLKPPVDFRREALTPGLRILPDRDDKSSSIKAFSTIAVTPSGRFADPTVPVLTSASLELLG